MSVAFAEHEAALQRARARGRAGERAEVAVAGLRPLTEPTAMLAAAAGALGDHSSFARVVVSAVHDGWMSAASAFVRDDPGGGARLLAALREVPVRLEHSLPEAEALRRRRLTIAPDRARAIAPVCTPSAAVAIVRAELEPGLALDEHDADALWTFATGLAQAHESACLRRALRDERRQMEQLAAWVAERSAALAATTADLDGWSRPDAAPDARRAPAAARPDGEGALERILTPREVDVLRLLAEGRTNRAIADELVIAHGTVKFHVNGILGKLRVANRAEAVARYFALLQVGRRARR